MIFKTLPSIISSITIIPNFSHQQYSIKNEPQNQTYHIDSGDLDHFVNQLITNTPHFPQAKTLKMIK